MLYIIMEQVNLPREVGALSWLSTFTNKNTTSLYRSVLRKFLKVQYNEGELEELANRYISDTRDVEADIQEFFKAIKEKSPKSIQVQLSIVRTFLIENRVAVDELVWKRLKRRSKGNGSSTNERHSLTSDQLGLFFGGLVIASPVGAYYYSVSFFLTTLPIVLRMKYAYWLNISSSRVIGA